jgi:putative peptidoglycan lipid II flippase
MSEKRRIARAAGQVGALTLASRVAGLLRDAVTGYYFGAGPAADAFFVAFRIPNLLRRLVGEGAMTAAFVPVFGGYLAAGRGAEAERALRAAVAVFGLALLGLTVLGVVLTPAWLALLAPGFAAEPASQALAERLARWLFPYLLLISLAALYGGYLNARRHFLAPALSPVLLNLGIIAAAVVLAPSLGLAALVAGVLLGGVLQVALQIAVLHREGVAVTPVWQPTHPALGAIARLLAPATLGTAMYQINVLLSTSIASLLPPGRVSALWYAGRLLEFPIGLVAVALGTAALPSFAEQAARHDRAEMRRSLSFAIALTNYVAIPAAVSLTILARPITAVLFQRGAFDAGDVDLTVAALQAYAAGLWALALVRVIAPAFYALRHPRAPLWAAAGGFLANVLASLALVGTLPGAGESVVGRAIAGAAAALQVADLGHVGLALAASIAVTANAALLAVPVARRLGGLEIGTIAGSLLRAAVASAVMAGVLAVLVPRVDWTTPGLGRALWLAVVIAAGGAVFAAAALLLGGSEVAALRRAVGARLRR